MPARSASGVGVKFVGFRCFTFKCSCASGMPSHSSLLTVASSRFKSANCCWMVGFSARNSLICSRIFFSRCFLRRSSIFTSTRSYTTSASLSSSSYSMFEKRDPA